MGNTRVVIDLQVENGTLSKAHQDKPQPINPLELKPGKYLSSNPIWKGTTLRVYKVGKNLRYSLFDEIRGKLAVTNLRNPPNDFKPIIP